MNRWTFIVLIGLLAGPSHATFELKDPASEVMDELENPQNAPENEAPARRAPSPKQQTAADTAPAAMGTVSTSKNIGETSCGDYVFYRQARSQWYLPSLYWLQGFIEGASHAQPTGAGSTDSDYIAAWVADFCRENRSFLLNQAATAYLDQNSNP